MGLADPLGIADMHCRKVESMKWLKNKPRVLCICMRMYVLRYSRMEYACAPLNTEQIIFETVEKLKLVLKHIVLCTAFSRMEYACAPLNTEQILCETVKKLKMVKINHFTARISINYMSRYIC